MIPVSTLAKTAYETFAKAQLARHGGSAKIYPWECLQGHEQAAWIASVQAVRNQLATVQ